MFKAYAEEAAYRKIRDRRKVSILGDILSLKYRVRKKPQVRKQTDGWGKSGEAYVPVSVYVLNLESP